MKKRKLIAVALLLMSISYIGNSKTASKTRKTKKTTTVRKKTSNSVKELNSQEYKQVLENFMKKAEKHLETGNKIKLVDDYINDIENAKVSKKALEDNKEMDLEAFGTVEVAIFMKSMFSEGADAKKMTDADYERIQNKFRNTKKFKQLEGYVEIQPVN